MNQRVFALLALSLFACRPSTPRYQSFADLDYGYTKEHKIWSPRAQCAVQVAELGDASSTATPLVLLHPWFTNMLIWSDITGALSSSRRVLLVDLPGHGKSGKSEGEYPISRLAGAVLDVLDDAKIERAIIVGNSLGGAAAIELALRAPQRVGGLVLLGAPGGAAISEELRHLVRNTTQGAMLDSLDGFSLDLGLSLAFRQSTALSTRLLDDILALRETREFPTFVRATGSALESVVEWHPKLEELKVPVLVVHSGDDLIVPIESGEELARRIPGARLERLEGCGHMPEVECPRLLLERMEPFLKGR